jgi:predicted RNA methylase
MARLVSQIKGGYYAAAPEAVAAVLERLRPPDQGECLILDPCAGEGKALLQLAEGLKAVSYGIELSEDRAAVVRASLPEGQALAPADFFRCAISYRSFSFVWCNPPYDYATGEEGRVESQFLERAVHLLVDNGVLALVCPEDVASSCQTFDFFRERFYEISAMPFPATVRKYNETVILGCKRKQLNTGDYSGYAWDWLEKRMEAQIVYKLPPGARPRQFRKSEPTDTELARLVVRSPLRFHLERSADKVNHRARPPMSPGAGHRAMLLASGHIDGLIHPADEPPHVIRGTATKDKYVASCDENEDEDGNVTTRTVISERPRLVIRVLDSAGNISALE